MLYKLAPRRRVLFRQVWLPAFIVTFALMLCQIAFVNYLPHFINYGIYGAVGGMMLLLLWVYLFRNYHHLRSLPLRSHRATQRKWCGTCSNQSRMLKFVRDHHRDQQNRYEKTQEGNRRDQNQDPADKTIFGILNLHSSRER